MMGTISIHEAKAKLSGLVARVEKGEKRILLSRYGKPVAQIVPYQPRRRTKPDSELSKIRYQGDLTAPTEGEWERA